MHVGIVVHPFGNSSKGLEQYVFESARSMLQESKDDISFTLFVKGNPDTSAFGASCEIVRLPDNPLWKLHLLFWRKKCDAFVFFTESAPMYLWKKSIIVFFDAAYYYFGSPTYSARIQRKCLVWWRRLMMQRVLRVVTISEASKKDLVEKFCIPADHVSVIYPGFKSLKPPVPDSEVDTGTPYFMYIGPIKERKNVAVIIDAFTLFKEMSGLPHELYLVGRTSKGVYEDHVQTRILASPYKESILFKTSISDDELYGVYNHAAALVFPSLLEGFGLPVLEALSCGCMVITSHTTSTKEALGNAGFLVNPHDSKEVAEVMVRVGSGDYDREEFKKRAILQCTKFSWERSGTEWYALFKLLHRF